MPASIERPHRLASTEYGLAAVCEIGTLCFCAYAIASGRESGFSRSGASVLRCGARARERGRERIGALIARVRGECLVRILFDEAFASIDQYGVFGAEIERFLAH